MGSFALLIGLHHEYPKSLEEFLTQFALSILNMPQDDRTDFEEANGFDNDKTVAIDPEGLIESNYDKVTDNFDDMSLREDLLRGIYAYGFEKPSAIQQRAIAPCIEGRDVIAQAQSGTGKTATFSISILEKIDINARDCQALILAPTRELPTNSEGGDGPGRLHGSAVPCLHRRHLCERGHA